MRHESHINVKICISGTVCGGNLIRRQPALTSKGVKGKNMTTVREETV